MSEPLTGDGSLWASPVYRRMLVWSFFGHVALAAGVALSPALRLRPSLPAPVYVSVIASAPAPAAAPAAPPRQEVDEIVIPERPKPKPKAKPKPPEPKPKAEPKPAVVPPEPAPKLDDLMAELQKETGVQADRARASRGRGGILDPERAAYKKRVESLVATNWVGAANCSARLRYPIWEVRLSPGGQVKSTALSRSSGNRYCDESAEHAILRTPLPPPPGAVRVLDVSFERE